MPVRLTQYAAGGGCACKIPPGELEEVVRGLAGHSSDDLVVGLEEETGIDVEESELKAIRFVRDIVELVHQKLAAVGRADG